MNRVHTVTQKHYRVKNPGQKPNWLHEPPTGPASAPGAPRRARLWPCCGRPGNVVAEPPGRVAAQPARPYTPAHPLVPPVATRPRASACAAQRPPAPSVSLPFLPRAPRPAAHSACLRAHCAPRLRAQLHAPHARAPKHARLPSAPACPAA